MSEDVKPMDGQTHGGKKPRTSLRVRDLPSRRGTYEDFTVKVELPQNFRAPWTEEYVEGVLLNPTATFAELAKQHGRTPASVNRVRCMIREVVLDKSYEADDARRNLVTKVLTNLGYETWDEETKKRYAVRGSGRRTDYTTKALGTKKQLI